MFGLSQDHLNLLVSLFLSFEKIKTQKQLKIINNSRIHLMVELTTGFLYLSLIKMAESIYF